MTKEEFDALQVGDIVYHRDGVAMCVVEKDPYDFTVLAEDMEYGVCHWLWLDVLSVSQKGEDHTSFDSSRLELFIRSGGGTQ